MIQISGPQLQFYSQEDFDIYIYVVPKSGTIWNPIEVMEDKVVPIVMPSQQMVYSPSVDSDLESTTEPTPPNSPRFLYTSDSPIYQL